MRIKSLFTSACVAVALTGTAGLAAAADDKCAISVDSTDAMQFDKKAIVVDKSCDQFTVTLTHSGQLGESVMGHNWVLTESDDVEAAARDGMNAGLDNNYVKSGDDRVLAFTEIIGGGEETSVTFDVDKLNPDTVYTYFCSFPGHYAVMRGTLTVK